MAQSVPASKFVNIVPGVVGTGGNPLSLNGVMLTADTSIPIGTVKTFSSASDVSDWFGAPSEEYGLAAVYFNGFENSTSKPGALHVAQFNDDAVAAYLRGGSMAAVTLNELKELSGTLTIDVDGDAVTSSAINFSGANSQSNAATLITAAFSGGDVVCTYDSKLKRFVLASATTGTGSTIGFPSSNSLSAGLRLDESLGAEISQGADAAVPASFMNDLLDLTQNWATFFTTWEPDAEGKEAFAGWANDSGERYLYIPWTSSDTISSFEADMYAGEYDGVYPVGPRAEDAAFVSGVAASIDFGRANGRVDIFFKYQSGLSATVTDSATYDALSSGGRNFIAAVATANDRFIVHVNGKMPGKWKWFDCYINQIYLNSQFQLALINLMMSVNSIPHNEFGRELLRAACQDPINEALNNGTIRTGIELSSAQKAIVNQQAGVEIDKTLYAAGYYLQILPATAQQRGNRESGPMAFWYTDGGGVHKINMPSIDIQ